MIDEKTSYITVIDALDNLKDLLLVCVLAHETASEKNLPMGVVYEFGLKEIDRIKEMIATL
jgi:hypothetical protein